MKKILFSGEKIIFKKFFEKLYLERIILTPKKVQTVRLELERKSFPDFRGMFPGVKNEMKFVSLELFSG